MGYAGFSLEIFLGAFWLFEAPDLTPGPDAMRKDMITHGASLV